MRFIVLVKGDKNYEAGALPSAELLDEMGKFNEELVKAGVILAGEGLSAELEGRTREIRGRKEDCHRWALRRVEGAGRGVLDLAVQESR